ncbi:SpaA isopeptide-forming pilin-related protein [Companilactobacillus nuruki]|nr:SpaA isopeptide-forming pilin-related protein [Companilactobacillus nuruki]
MKNKKLLLLISMIGLFFTFFMISNTQIAMAASSPPGTQLTSNSASPVAKKEIPITGLTSSEATVTNMSGQVVKPSDELFSWDNFHVDYNWSLPDGIQIENGDTTTFELPSGLVSNGNLSFPIYDNDGQEIGTATIENGSSSGTITFNNSLSNTDTNRKGTLTLVSKGTSTGNGVDGSNWMFNKIGWVSGYDNNGLPNEVTWNVAFNPNLHQLNNVVITDTLGPNQEYISGSLTANAGHYESGSFINDAGQLQPIVTTDGSKVIISFPGKVTTAVDIYYRVKLTDTTNGTNIWSNHATMGSSDGNYTVNADTSWGGSGTGTGDIKTGSVTLTKIDATTQKKLEGAIFELTDSTGKIITDNIRTDQNGTLSINDLPFGDYVLTEVIAPDGYQLNDSPIKFSIPNNGNSNATLTQEDTGKLGAVVLKKLDSINNNLIAGTTFNLLDNTGNIIKSGLVTDLNGEISVSDLPAGNYSFVETHPAAGYIINDTPIDFTVVAGETTPVTLDKFNVAKPVAPSVGSVTLTKYDVENDKVLPRATYELFDNNDKLIQSNLVTDKNGQIILNDLVPGNYYLVEVSSPDGFEISIKKLHFTIIAGEDVAILGKDRPETDIPTEPPLTPDEPSETDSGSVILTKLDAATNSVIPGTVFDLFDSSGKTIAKDLTTNDKGQIAIDNLFPGKYTLVEKKPAAGYTSNKAPIEFTVSIDKNTNVKVLDKKKPKPPVTGPANPTEPSKPVPPTNPLPPVGPTEPGKPVPPTNPLPPAGPTEPGKPVPPTNPLPPVGPIEPSKPVLPVNPIQPETPIPSYPGAPGTDQVSSPNTHNNELSNSSNPQIYHQYKNPLPQTGNSFNLFLVLSGLFLALFIILKHLIKKV